MPCHDAILNGVIVIRMVIAKASHEWPATCQYVSRANGFLMLIYIWYQPISGASQFLVANGFLANEFLVPADFSCYRSHA